MRAAVIHELGADPDVEQFPDPPRGDDVAEVVAAALCRLYGLDGYLPHSREYVEAYSGKDGRVTGLEAVRVEWVAENGRMAMREVPGSGFHIKADLVLLAMGFVHPVHGGAVRDVGVDLDQRGNLKATDRDYATSVTKVFAAGDARRGQSLVVWAIREGRQCARAVDEFLMGRSDLPR